MVTIITIALCIWLVLRYTRKQVSSPRSPPPAPIMRPQPTVWFWEFEIKGYSTKLVVGPVATLGEAIYEVCRQGFDYKKIKSHRKVEDKS